MLQFELLEPDTEPRAHPLPVTIGERIATRLVDGCHLTRSSISALFAEETGIQNWGTAWSIDDYNDAIEIGALLWLKSNGRITLDTAIHDADARFELLETALPPRHVRSEAQIELQQFSTPPMLSWLMAHAAQLRSSDRGQQCQQARHHRLQRWLQRRRHGLASPAVRAEFRQTTAAVALLHLLHLLHLLQRLPLRLP